MTPVIQFTRFCSPILLSLWHQQHWTSLFCQSFLLKRITVDLQTLTIWWVFSFTAPTGVLFHYFVTLTYYARIGFTRNGRIRKSFELCLLSLCFRHFPDSVSSTSPDSSSLDGPTSGASTVPSKLCLKNIWFQSRKLLSMSNVWKKQNNFVTVNNLPYCNNFWH